MAKATSFDLATLDTRAACDVPAEIELKHPATNEPLGMFISLLGKDSTPYKTAVKALRNAAFKKAGLAQRKGQKVELTTADDIDANSIDLVVAATIGWRDGVNSKATFTIDGAEVAFSAQTAKAFYERFDWAKEQVDEYIEDLENFMKRK